MFSEQDRIVDEALRFNQLRLEVPQFSPSFISLCRNAGLFCLLDLGGGDPVTTDWNAQNMSLQIKSQDVLSRTWVGYILQSYSNVFLFQVRPLHLNPMPLLREATNGIATGERLAFFGFQTAKHMKICELLLCNLISVKGVTKIILDYIQSFLSIPADLLHYFVETFHGFSSILNTESPSSAHSNLFHLGDELSFSTLKGSGGLYRRRREVGLSLVLRMNGSCRLIRYRYSESSRHADYIQYVCEEGSWCLKPGEASLVFYLTLYFVS